MTFPAGFTWGSATAALQIEGRAGRGPSVWDDFCRAHPERIHEGANPDVACDHVHRWREDVEWIRRLGHNGYRFSISWPRVDPAGDGRWNQEGIDFYDRLVDALLDAGIEPNATLYHWDLPSPLGSWEDPGTTDAFVGYAAACVGRLGDRVKRWATLNEPAWTILNGYVTGLHPPCRRDHRAAIGAAHQLLTAHAAAIDACRGLSRGGAFGIALNLSPVYPASDSEQDAHAASLADGILNRWFLEPVLLGRYPADVVALYERCGLVPDGGLDLPLREVDWIGVNYYYPHHASADAPDTEFHLNTSGNPAEACRLSVSGLFRMVQNPRGRYTRWNWEIDPAGLQDVLLRVHSCQPDLPVYVTENGLGLADGGIHDAERIDFVRSHLEAVERALAAGVDVRGYYMWSLMDNFSWINGYKKRYGFLHVDRESMQRTPRDSAWWFRRVARANGLIEDQGTNRMSVLGTIDPPTTSRTRSSTSKRSSDSTPRGPT